MRTVCVTRYVTPLREGGSLPAVIEADDDGMYVLKFRGAGQGRKALIAELLGGEIARALGLAIPEIVFAELDPELARTEPDSEIQELVRASAGLNLALDFLPGSVTFDPLAHPVAHDIASEIVWLDAYITNVDRTARNANLLCWHRRVWLIDHGAALYFHHDWNDVLARARKPFPMVKDHVLFGFAAEAELKRADEDFSRRLTPELLAGIVALIPDAWLAEDEAFPSVDQHRAAYVDYLVARLESPRAFADVAMEALRGK